MEPSNNLLYYVNKKMKSAWPKEKLPGSGEHMNSFFPKTEFEYIDENITFRNTMWSQIHSSDV